MIHHLFPGRAEHHIPAMIEYFQSIAGELHVAAADQVFVFYAATTPQFERYARLLPAGSRAVAIGPGKRGLFHYLKELGAGDALILHSAFYPWIWLALLGFPRLWKRTAWIMWGADIYGTPGLKGCLYRKVKSLVVPRLGAVSALVPGDFNDLQRLVGRCPNYVRAFYAPFFGANAQSLAIQARSRNGGATRLLLGNSGWEQNDHIPALHWLSRFADRDFQVLCPLGYPRQSVYKSAVIEAGRQLLGERFQPIEALLPWDEYHALLASCDILALNCANQQGLGNIYAMMLRGGKLFLRGDSSPYAMLQEFGFHVYDTRKLAELTFEEMIAFTEEQARRNRELFEQHLSTTASIAGWKSLLRKIGSAPPSWKNIT